MLPDLPATTVASLPTVLSAAEPTYPPVAANPPPHVSPVVSPAALPAVPPPALPVPHSRPVAADWIDRRVPDVWAWDAAPAQTAIWNGDLDVLT